MVKNYMQLQQLQICASVLCLIQLLIEKSVKMTGSKQLFLTFAMEKKDSVVTAPELFSLSK